MVVDTKENLKIIISMDTENINGKMEKFIKDNGKIIKCTDMV
jgi:hypothetical protein